MRRKIIQTLKIEKALLPFEVTGLFFSVIPGG